MGQLRPFQVIILGFFFAFAVGGLIFFTVFRGFGSDPNPYGERVEIWGTLERDAFDAAFAVITEEDDQFAVVEYVEKDSRTFRNELVNAIAEGRGPDAIVLEDNLLLSERAKLYPIPYEVLPARTLRDTYVDGASIFSFRDGTYGIPFAVDPLVLYWNRDLFATAGLAYAPRTWEELTASAVPRLVRLAESPNFTVLQAALAFGEYANITHAAKILYTLFLQAGSPLGYEEERGVTIGLMEGVGQGRDSGEIALDFYTQFANPSRATYTWNRSLSQDRAAFLAGDLAMYFAPGSEYQSIRAGNANLNFDSAEIPQGSGTEVKKSYGTFYALSLLRSSDNFDGSYQALLKLSQPAYVKVLVDALGIAPVHRSIVATGDPDPFRQTMYTMALFARGFLDPNPNATPGIIRTMVEDVTSGRMSVSSAVGDAEIRLNQQLP